LKIKVLIVEDQFIEAHSLERILLRANYSVCSIARSVPIALKIIEKERPDLVLLDIYLQGDLTGIDLAKSLKERNIPFVYLSANSTKQVLHDAKETKPYGFLVKPVREKDVLVMLDVAWYLHQQSQLPLMNGKNLKDIPSFTSTNPVTLIGRSAPMREVTEQIQTISNSDISVLILGESGTGKEMIAKEIHRSSSRKDKPFVVVNCSALPANLVESELFGHEKGAFTGAIEKRTGKFEQANNGTIFLDEIGELPLEMQVKFLRVLQEREIESIGGKLKKINVRVIAATNRILEEELAKGNFRIDLYYRLNIFPITLPPLRERKADIPLLVKHFINHYSKETNKTITGITDEALKALLNYNWPGNVRELENIIYRSLLVNSGPLIEKVGLPSKSNDRMPSKFETIAENERNYILLALEKCNWKVAGIGGAAALLDLKVSTLTSRIKKLGIKRPV
jgi:two-component system, NtrC family, response regulator HydG